MDLSNEVVIHQKVGDVEFLQFRKLLEYPQIKHAYGLKTLDFRKREKNNPREESYQKLLEVLQIDDKSLLKPDQKHTDHLLTITKKENQDKPDIDLPYLEAIDGTITNQSNITLASTNADCILLLCYDTRHQVIANVHSGWRGTFQKIAPKTIHKMKEEFQSNSEDIIVAICPSIRVCHFEVDSDVKEECEKIFKDTGRLVEMIKVGRVVEEKQKYNIDTVLINKILLEQEGILSENILDSGICSVCAKEKIHSRRVEGPSFGVGSAVIKII